jgi:hypothetical protein
MAKFARRAEFDIMIIFKESGVTYRDEVVSFSGSYALNSIPTGMATIAAGREVRSAAPSQIHSTLQTLKLREAVEVRLKVTLDRGDTGINGMDGQWCTIFEGYYAGCGYQRTHESANYTLRFIHWLDDLACSSALNGSWHPGVPHDLAQCAEGDMALATGGSNISKITCIVDPEFKIVNGDNIRSDLWGDVLKKLFDELAQKKIGQQSPEKDGDPESKGNNAAARKALEKMPGDSPNPAKLPLNIDLGDTTTSLAAVIAISDMIKTGLAYSSFWSKLIGEFGPEFLFGISPAATFANVIPYFGGIYREWVTIYGSEYNYASFNNSLVSLIESVELRFAQNPTSAIWAAGGKLPSVSYYRPIARFPDPNTEHRGQVIIKDPPAWITNTVPAAVYGPLATGVQGKPADVGGQGNENPPADVKRPADEEKSLRGSNIVKAYARHLYKTEVLAQRRGELSGKLRFDIAPGSIVKIDAPDTDIVPDGQELNVKFYAMVTQVSFVINAETHSAGTSFALTNLRTAAENEKSQYTEETSPAYPKERWNGGPLVKEAMPNASAPNNAVLGGGGNVGGIA